MRRALVGTALTAIATLAIAQPAQAAAGPTPATSASLHLVSSETDKTAFAHWETDPISTTTGYKQSVWDVQFVTLNPFDLQPLLSAQSCVNHYDVNGQLTRQICTQGQTTRFAYTVDTANLSHASVRAWGIPAQRCAYDGAGIQLWCEPVAPLNVTATWTGQGPITYAKFVVFTPGVYRLVDRTKSREATASASFNRNSPPGKSVFAAFYVHTAKQWGV